MTNPIDEILDKFWAFAKTPQGPMTEEQDLATLDKRQAKQSLITYIETEIIGEDEDYVDTDLEMGGYNLAREFNQLRASQRAILRKDSDE